MIRAFVDSSVLVSACISSTGASREIMKESIRGAVLLTISEYVLEETERTLRVKRPDTVPVVQELVESIPFEVASPTQEQILDAAQYTDIEDAPIIAAAKQAQVDYVVSLNRRHLVGVPEVSLGSGLLIVLPEELLRQIRGE